MDGERHETFERVPWETLQRPARDRQWGMFAIAGAVVIGSLAYSYMSGRPAPQPPAATTAPVAVAPPPVAPAPPVTSPVLVSEADLFAVDPDRLLGQASAHAEWFVAEYLAMDGSATPNRVLAGLLPAGVPAPVAPEGTRVFVEWVRALTVEEIAPFRYRIGVLARTLSAPPGGEYQRREPLLATVEVVVGEMGPVVAMPPRLAPMTGAVPARLDLAPVPAEVEAAARTGAGVVEVLGGIAGASGDWLVVAMVTGPDGVSRPVTIVVP